MVWAIFTPQKRRVSHVKAFLGGYWRCPPPAWSCQCSEIGYAGHPSIPCRCTEAQRRRYAAKMSGPIWDRIDLRVWVPPLGDAEVFSSPAGEPSATIRSRVLAAQKMQEARYASLPLTRNAELRPGMFAELCCETGATQEAFLRAKHQLELSFRRLDILRKVSRTCADLRGSPDVEEEDVERARQFLEVLMPSDEPQVGASLC